MKNIFQAKGNIPRIQVNDESLNATRKESRQFESSQFAINLDDGDKFWSISDFDGKDSDKTKSDGEKSQDIQSSVDSEQSETDVRIAQYKERQLKR